MKEIIVKYPQKTNKKTGIRFKVDNSNYFLSYKVLETINFPKENFLKINRIILKNDKFWWNEC